MITGNLYKVPILLDPQPEGGWTITCPILPGLITEADTAYEVPINVADALNALIECYEELRQPIPDVLNPIPCNAPFMAYMVVQLRN